MKWTSIKIRAGKYLKDARVHTDGEKLTIKFPFSRQLIDDIKAMSGSRWNPDDKSWTFDVNPHNLFQFAYLMDEPVYEAYDKELIDFTPSRDKVYNHQIEMIQHIITRRYCMLCGEMGTGKTLAFIEAIEAMFTPDDEIWYIGPKSGVRAVERELVKWGCKIPVEFFTYEKLVSTLKTPRKAPKFVCFDECSRIKTPTAKRSQACMHLADSVRTEHGSNGGIVLMSGTPAPRQPVDWWHQCEVARPGFVKEGTYAKFKKRLCLVEMRQNLITGGEYPHLITWLDDENKCATCGELRDHAAHIDLMERIEILADYRTEQAALMERIDATHNKELLTRANNLANSIRDLSRDDSFYHTYKKSENEVAALYERMQGLVLVKFKKDCLDLPDKQYFEIEVKANIETIRAMKTIKKRATRAVEALNLVRELSDGFQYQQIEIGKQTCRLCNGDCKREVPMPVSDEEFVFEPQVLDCDHCGGTGTEPVYERQAIEVECPKDDEFINLLDEADEDGRFVVWGAFKGTIDRLVTIAHREGWSTLCVDGRGYRAESHKGEPLDSDELLDAMDGSNPRRSELFEKHPKVCFVGHPKAGGMGLTLTASNVALYYSNPFSAEDRMQSEDRIHRAGMDVNRGCKIIDLFHLPTDRLVAENLKKKRDLQSLTMGELDECINGK